MQQQTSVKTALGNWVTKGLQRGWGLTQPKESKDGVKRNDSSVRQPKKRLLAANKCMSIKSGLSKYLYKDFLNTILSKLILII